MWWSEICPSYLRRARRVCSWVQPIDSQNLFARMFATATGANACGMAGFPSKAESTVTSCAHPLTAEGTSTAQLEISAPPVRGSVPVIEKCPTTLSVPSSILTSRYETPPARASVSAERQVSTQIRGECALSQSMSSRLNAGDSRSVNASAVSRQDRPSASRGGRSSTVTPPIVAGPRSTTGRTSDLLDTASGYRRNVRSVKVVS